MIVLRRQAFPGQVVAQRWPLDAGNSIGDRENSPAARGRSLATIVQLKFIRELQAADTQLAPVAPKPSAPAPTGHQASSSWTAKRSASWAAERSETSHASNTFILLGLVWRWCNHRPHSPARNALIFRGLHMPFHALHRARPASAQLAR
jgi:hypothetical protein